MKKLGIYLHIPFCKSKCHYCDFCSFPNRGQNEKETYCQTLQREIALRARELTEYEVDTVYFGGGTPTALPSALLCSLLETVKAHFRVSENAEITAECNPATADTAYFAAMREAGFNRLSIGVQSFHAHELQLLGRAHTAADAEATVRMAREAGFANISVDLMYGIPAQTRESFAESVRAACALGVQHVSAYALKIEPGTPFDRIKHTLTLPDEDAVADMYEDCVALFAAHGIPRYEISNFARPGYESRHNLKYWECDEYLGVGAAAHSYLRGNRAAYEDRAAFMSGHPVEVAYEAVTPLREQEEYVMLSLRLEKGIDKSAFLARFGKNFDAIYGGKLAPYVRAGFVEDNAATCRFTTKGFLVSNTVLADVLEFD